MIRILQISDIHWRDSLKNLDTFKPIQDGLIEDLKRAKKKGITFDRILICGDVAFSGARIQYGRAKDYIQELWEHGDGYLFHGITKSVIINS